MSRSTLPSLRAGAIGALGLALLTACGGADATSPVSTPLPDSKVASVELTPVSTVLVVGTRQPLFLTARTAGGQVLAGRVGSWSSSDSRVVSVAQNGAVNLTPGNPAALAYANGSGSATITATVDGRSASVKIHVVSPTATQSVLTIESFSMIEYKYDGEPDQWYYAPIVRLRETTGARSADVLAVQFHMPGFGYTMKCGARLHVLSGQSVDMFRESYGDYPLSYYRPPDGRALPGLATALITVRDDNGAIALLSMEGPIVSGSLPTTYTGGHTVTDIEC